MSVVLNLKKEIKMRPLIEYCPGPRPGPGPGPGPGPELDNLINSNQGVWACNISIISLFFRKLS